MTLPLLSKPPHSYPAGVIWLRNFSNCTILQTFFAEGLKKHIPAGMANAGGKDPPLVTLAIARGKGFLPLQLSIASTLLKAEGVPPHLPFHCDFIMSFFQMWRLELNNYLNTCLICLGLVKAKQMLKSTYCLGKNCWIRSVLCSPRALGRLHMN